MIFANRWNKNCKSVQNKLSGNSANFYWSVVLNYDMYGEGIVAFRVKDTLKVTQSKILTHGRRKRMSLKRAKLVVLLTIAFFVNMVSSAWSADSDIKYVYYTTKDGNVIKAEVPKALRLASEGNSTMWERLRAGYVEALLDPGATIKIEDKKGRVYDWSVNLNSVEPQQWSSLKMEMNTNPLKNTKLQIHPNFLLGEDGKLKVASYPLQQGKIIVDGIERIYDYYVPTSYDGKNPVPLVLSFHGFMSNGTGQRNLTGLDLLAEEEGFIVVFPYGRPVPPELARMFTSRTDLFPGYQGRWNVGLPPFLTSDADDVKFICFATGWHLTSLANLQPSWV